MSLNQKKEKLVFFDFPKYFHTRKHTHTYGERERERDELKKKVGIEE